MGMVVPLEIQIASAGLPRPVGEWRFHPSRKWRFDWAWPDLKIAVEIEGGVYSGGRHVRGKGFEGDARKYNAAAELGWRVYRFSTQMIRKGEALGLLLRVLKEQ